MTDQDTTHLQPVVSPRDSDPLDPVFGLPSGQLANARKRLGTFVAFIGSALGIATVAQWLVPIDWQLDSTFLLVTQVGEAVLVFAHIVFYVVIRKSRASHALVLNLGLAYEVVLVLIIATANHALNFTQGVDYDDRVVAALVIALYPIIVPSPPRRAFWSSFTAGAMLPLGILILHPLGMPGTGQQYLVTTAIGLLSTAAAVMGSRVIYGIHVEAGRVRRLGSYELQSRLGQGGMGEVWRARHRLLARPAAVKLIRPEVLGTSGSKANLILKRFEREAQATAAMESSHTIELYDFGISHDGTFYYVMELLDGLDLDQLVARFGPVSPARAIYLLRQVCDSLGEAHEEGLIHRDIKPANIYVCRHGRETDFVKVLDFGLVTAGPETSRDDITLTADHVVRGTPAFMAPEQFSGSRRVDARTDLYALGCVAYWLLTGRLVFEGTSVVETMMFHLKETPQPPSTVSDMPIPDDVDRAVLACLEKDPARRPASADILSEMLASSTRAPEWIMRDANAWWDAHLPKERRQPS